MESLEFLEKQQPWQEQALERAYALRDFPENKMTRQQKSDVCLPPPNTTISIHVCCGGGILRRAFAGNPAGNDILACRGLSKRDYKRLRRIALLHTTPLPTMAVKSEQDPSPHDGTMSIIPGRNANSSGTSAATVIKCDSCRIVDLLWKNRLSVQFVGDSMTHQMTDGWRCELESRNYLVTMTPHSKGDAHSIALHVRSPHWADGDMVNVTFFNVFKIPQDLNEWSYMKPTGATMLVLNLGLHWVVNASRPYHLPSSYELELHRTLQHFFSQKEHYRLLFFRESSAQHFASDSGEFMPWWRQEEERQQMGNSSGSGDAPKCVKHALKSHVGWRYGALGRVAQAAGWKLSTSDSASSDDAAKELIVIPFAQYTAELFFLHPTHTVSKTLDCTHFCQSPYLWWPVWRSIRLGMEQRLVG